MKRLGLAMLAALTMSLVIAATASGAIVIHKIYYNPPGRDTLTNSQLDKEFISLKNTGSRAKSLRGWTIKDASGHTYTFGTYSLCAGCGVRIHTGRGTNTHGDRYWGSKNYIWNNDGDTARLRNSSGTVKDKCSYSGGDTYKLC